MRAVDTERKRERSGEGKRFEGWEEKFMAGIGEKTEAEEFLFPLDSYNMVRYASMPRRGIRNRVEITRNPRHD